VGADDSKVGKASFKNAKYASLKELSDFSASKLPRSSRVSKGVGFGSVLTRTACLLPL
jgi:hypothetical protein